MSRPNPERDAQMAAMYFEENMTQAEIAKQFGITAQSVSKILNKDEILDEYDKKRKAQTLRAKIKLAAATERAVDVQRAYLDMELPINLEYLRQNAARDILDRSGVKTEATPDDNKIVIEFKEPFALGMPGHSVTTYDDEGAEVEYDEDSEEPIN